MDGDFPPVHQILSAGKELFPLGNVVFYVDEAHSNGIMGPKGSGYICHHGLEDEFAIRVHSKFPTVHLPPSRLSQKEVPRSARLGNC
jgi:8-amino-7-oxononanoate synthase